MLEVDCGVDLLEVDCGVDLLEVDCGVDLLEVDCGVDLLDVDCGVGLLDVDCGVDTLEVDCGEDTLEIKLWSVSLDIGSLEETTVLVCESAVLAFEAVPLLSPTDVGTETDSLSDFDALSADDTGCDCVICDVLLCGGVTFAVSEAVSLQPHKSAAHISNA